MSPFPRSGMRLGAPRKAEPTSGISSNILSIQLLPASSLICFDRIPDKASAGVCLSMTEFIIYECHLSRLQQAWLYLLIGIGRNNRSSSRSRWERISNSEIDQRIASSENIVSRSRFFSDLNPYFSVVERKQDRLVNLHKRRLR
jgi:hypothetical protein